MGLGGSDGMKKGSSSRGITSSVCIAGVGRLGPSAGSWPLPLLPLQGRHLVLHRQKRACARHLPLQQW